MMKNKYNECKYANKYTICVYRTDKWKEFYLKRFMRLM